MWLLIFLLLLAFFCGLDLGWILAVTCSAILKALCRLWLLIHSRSDSQWRRWRDGATSRTCFLVYVDKHYTYIDKISLYHTWSTYLQVQRTIMVTQAWDDGREIIQYHRYNREKRERQKQKSSPSSRSSPVDFEFQNSCC